jgi:putative DNA primase/helicase
MELAKQTARAIKQEALNESDPARTQEIIGWYVKSLSITRLRAMVDAASSIPTIVVGTDAAQQPKVDMDPWLLNLQNGTIDLRTGQLRPHSRADMITKLANVPYDPDAQCPTFMEFLSQIMCGRKELVEFLQKMFGYSLTGDTREDCAFFMHGEGRNGKGTLVETIMSILGDYATAMARDTLIVKRNGGGIPNDVAMLRGARLVTTSETGDGERWYVKSLLCVHVPEFMTHDVS